jgi:outer membrane lipoprotein-sorting protein
MFSFQFISAQNNVQAEQILTDLLTSAKTNAIKTNFKLIILQKKDPIPQISSGTFTLKSNKFVLEMDAMNAWFDGKTQWAYIPQSNEVSITEPTEKELSETNPMSVLSGFKTKCSIKFSSKIKSNQNYCIEMIPKITNKDISKIEVQINKTNGNLFSIKINNKNGDASVLTLSNFQKGLNVSENIFVFNPSKYKGITINDLR